MVEQVWRQRSSEAVDQIWVTWNGMAEVEVKDAGVLIPEETWR